MSFLYDAGREGFLGGAIDWDTDDIRQILVDTGAYTANQATHVTLADIPAGARIAVSAALAGKTVLAGVANHSAVTHGSVSGASVEAIVYYKHTGAETARLIAYVDTASAGLPVSPNSGDITVTPDSGANKVFKL